MKSCTTDTRLREYKNIVDSTVEAIIGTDLEGIITSWNPGAEDFYGYSSEEAIGQHVSMIAPESERHETKEIIETAVAGKPIKEKRTIRITKDGDVELIVPIIRLYSNQSLWSAIFSTKVNERLHNSPEF
jgi:PAS domain S-box-containing protein